MNVLVLKILTFFGNKNAKMRLIEILEDSLDSVIKLESKYYLLTLKQLNSKSYSYDIESGYYKHKWNRESLEKTLNKLNKGV